MTNQTLSFREDVARLHDSSDEEKLGELLNRAHAEDPTILVEYSKELKQTILQGQGEHHLNILKWTLANVHKVEVEFFAPRISYRETITKTAQAGYRHKKQSGGAGQFAKVKIKFEPMEGYTGFEFHNTVVGGNVPKEYIPGVEKGLRSAMDTGVLAGYPVTGVKCTLYDGAYHEVDSNVMCFEIAARAAFRDGMRQADARLLEPIMKVEVVTPEEYMGDIIGDLNSRRGMVNGMDQRGNARVVDAHVPLANMFGYVNTLRSLSQGRAQFTMVFDHYQEVPKDIAEKVKAKNA